MISTDPQYFADVATSEPGSSVEARPDHNSAICSAQRSSHSPSVSSTFSRPRIYAILTPRSTHTTMKAYLRALRLTSRRQLSTTSARHLPSSFGSGPAPPRLPEKDQRLFEELQRASTGAFSTPRTTVVVNQPSSPSRPQINQSPHSTSSAALPSESDQAIEAVNARVQATGDGEELHPDVRRGAKPEFEGDRNPKTGEVGGPKNEPLRWGGDVDWSYNGRVTDF